MTKFILTMIIAGYIGWNGGGKWKMSMLETLFIVSVFTYLINK